MEEEEEEGGEEEKKITVHLLNLLFVAAVGISLLRWNPLPFSPQPSVGSEHENSTSCNSTATKTQELETRPERWRRDRRGSKKGGRRGEEKVRSPLPRRNTRSSPGRSAGRGRGYRIYSWQLPCRSAAAAAAAAANGLNQRQPRSKCPVSLPRMRDRERERERERKREGDGQGETQNCDFSFSPACGKLSSCELVGWRVLWAQFPLPGGAVEGRGAAPRLSLHSHASSLCLCGARAACRSVSRIFGFTRLHSLLCPFIPASLQVPAALGHMGGEITNLSGVFFPFCLSLCLR